MFSGASKLENLLEISMDLDRLLGIFESSLRWRSVDIARAQWLQ